MSEIKGQLFGIVLVIAVFTVVISIITSSFQYSAEAIQQRAEDIVYTGTTKPSTHSLDADYVLHY